MPVERPGAQLRTIEDRGDTETSDTLFPKGFGCRVQNRASHARIGSELVSSPCCRLDHLSSDSASRDAR